VKYYRWGDDDRRFGPFIYARDLRGYRPFALVLSSGGGHDNDAVCTLRASAFGHTLIAILPAVIKPWRRWVDLSKYEWATERDGVKGYWDQHAREYGFSLNDGHLHVKLGAETGDSSTTQDWSCFLPWTQWRHVRTSIYDRAGRHYWTEPNGGFFENYEARKVAEKSCAVTFSFDDFDGETLTVDAIIKEREWHFGTGWCKWLSWFRRPKISRSLDLSFSGETGRRKGSWKGGTVGHSIEMKPGERHEPAFRRYCSQNEMEFGGEVDNAATG
jgi:hypothetical protein